jgi:hypothetical protein
MLDPRIYRTGLIAVALGVIVLAFSLTNQQGPMGTTLAPDAFNGQNAYTTTTKLAAAYPRRLPGSLADRAIAGVVAQGLRRYGFTVSKSTFKGVTVEGTRTLENVVGLRAGLSSGSIVVVSHRDALHAPSVADASGTAVLLELARVLSGQTQHRSIVLASTSGSTGAAAAARLARSVPGPVDAVIVLGDLAGTKVHQPLVDPWSNSRLLAPPVLRNTVSAALAAQSGLRGGGTSFAGQLVRLAFPISVSEQAPFASHGQPAVRVSVSGERVPAANEPTSPDQITGLGRGVLQSINALDTGSSLPGPSAYLLYSGKVVPAWAVRLLVLAMMLPVMLATVDGLARARRRGHAISRWTIWVLSAALPFALAALFVLFLKLVGLIDVAPPNPVGPGAVALHGNGIAALGLVAFAIAVSFLWLRPVVMRSAGIRRRTAPSPGAGSALLLVLCVVSLLMWLTNPFAAVLLVPALHLWLWVVDPEVRLRRGVALVLLAIGMAPPVLAAVYYALSVGLSPLQAIWNGMLMLAGGAVGPVAALEWSIVIGCALSSLLIVLRSSRQPALKEAPITVRGPVTYAGPGSLGGTESALRR